MKAPTVKFTIILLHKPPFCGAHKYFTILLVGSVLYVSYLPFNDYSTHSKFEEAIGFLNDQNCRREKMTNESTYGEICNSTPTQTCVLRCTQIFHNLIGWKCIVCILFALQRLFDEFNHFTTFFQCKTDEKVRSTARTKIMKTQFVPRTVS